MESQDNFSRCWFRKCLVCFCTFSTILRCPRDMCQACTAVVLLCVSGFVLPKTNPMMLGSGAPSFVSLSSYFDIFERLKRAGHMSQNQSGFSVTSLKSAVVVSAFVASCYLAESMKCVCISKVTVCWCVQSSAYPV